MNQDYKQLLTDVIKKQIVILGPDITLSKARNVKELTIADDGTVTAVAGNPQLVIQALIDQFVQLSGLIVKKTMEPLLAISQPTAPAQPQPVIAQAAPVTPVQPTPQSAAPEIPSAQQAQAILDQAASQTPASPTPQPPAPNPLAA